MATKETLRGQYTRFRQWEAEKSALSVAAELGSFLLLGAILAGAQVFRACAPFGVAAVAAAGAGFPGVFTLLGSLLGYLLFYGQGGSLHYAAACMLTFGTAFAAAESELRQRMWFMPAAAAVFCALTSFVRYYSAGFRSADVIFFITEILLAAAAVYCYQGAVEAQRQMDKAPDMAGLSQYQRVGVFALGGTVLIALSAITFMGEFSLGRIVGAAFVMLAARRGISGGLLAGELVGMALDLASGRSYYYCMAFAISGLLAGCSWNRKKRWTALSFGAASLFVVLWTWEIGMRTGLIYEVLAAMALFLLLPKKVCAAGASALAVPKAQNLQWEQVKKRATGHMQATARAFRELYEHLRGTFQRETYNVENPADIFRRAVDKHCAKCALRERCWQEQFQSTQDALNSATAEMLKRGRAIAGDFPPHLRSSCINFSELLPIINEELSSYLYRRQYQKHMRDNRAAICRQYAEIDHILVQAAAELSAPLTPDLPRAGKLNAYLRSQGIEPSGAVYYSGEGRLRVETPAVSKLGTGEGRERLEKVLGTALREGEHQDDGRYMFHQAEPFKAVASVFGKSKDGEAVSGDAGTWFRRDDGLLCILLCDGMGSGRAARDESSLAVRLLQNFLKAGVEAETALRTVNSALALKGEETGGCTTVDLLTIELYTGLCSVYKFGAAGTYLRRKGAVSKIKGSPLPAGILSGEDVRPEITRFPAAPGDWILLLSDGVVAGQDDTWLCQLLEESQGKTPGEMVQAVIQKSAGEQSGADDSTVIAVQLEKRRQ